MKMKVKYYILPKGTKIRAYFDGHHRWEELKTAVRAVYRPEELSWFGSTKNRVAEIDLQQFKGWQKNHPLKIEIDEGSFSEILE